MVNSRAPKVLSIGSETSNSGITDDAEVQFNPNIFLGTDPVTIGTASQVIQITAIEYKTGATAVDGTCNLIALIVDANPPTTTSPTFVAISEENTNGATSTTYKVNMTKQPVFQGGQLIMALINHSTGDSRTRYNSVSSRNAQFAKTYATPPVSSTVTWAVNTQDTYLKIYYRVIT